MEKDNKITISLLIPEFLVEKLKEQANKDCTSISYLIRKAILKFLDEEENKDGNK